MISVFYMASRDKVENVFWDKRLAGVKVTGAVNFWLLLTVLFCLLAPPAGAQDPMAQRREFFDRLGQMSSTEKLAALDKAMGKLVDSSKKIIALLDAPDFIKKKTLAVKFAEADRRLQEAAHGLEDKLFPRGAPLTDSARVHIAKGLEKIQRNAEKQAAGLAAQHQKLDEQQRIICACGVSEISKAEEAEAQAKSTIDQISHLVAGVSVQKRRGLSFAEPYQRSDGQLKAFAAQAGQIHREWLRNQKAFAAIFGDKGKASAYFDSICSQANDLRAHCLENSWRACAIVAKDQTMPSISLDDILDDIEDGKPAKSESESVYRAFLYKNKNPLEKSASLYRFSSCDKTDIDKYKNYHRNWPAKQPPQIINNLKTTADILNALMQLDTINKAAVDSLQRAMAKAEKAGVCLAELRKKRQNAMSRLNCPKNAEPFWPKGAELPSCRCQKGWVFNTDKSGCLPKNYCKMMIQRYQDNLKSGDREKAQAALNLLRLKKCPNLAALNMERTVPDVIRLPQNKAIAALQKAGLGHAISSAGQATERENARRVFQQDPKPGERVDAGAVVRLKVFDTWDQAKAKAGADKLCARKYPGAQGLWNQEENKFGCGCPRPATWNRDKTACVVSKTAAMEECRRRYPGTSPRWNEKTQRWDCHCPDGLTWDKIAKKCINQKELAQANCRKKYPGSVARYSKEHGEYRCFCPEGMDWNKQGNACISAKVKYQAICDEKYPGSTAVWNQQKGAFFCTCANGRRWNRDKTECLMSQAEANAACTRQIANTVAKFNPKQDTYDCLCAGDRIWQPKHKRCSQSKAEAQQRCSREYTGSEARYSQQDNDYRCYCPDGFAWDKNRTGCVQTAQSVQALCNREYPGTTARWVKEMGEYRCFCPGNAKWDPQRKECPRSGGGGGQAQSSGCSRLAQAYMQQVNSFKSTGGVGSTAGLWNILNQARNCNWYFQEARNVKCLDLAREFDQAFVYVDANNQYTVNAVKTILAQAQGNGCSWCSQAQAALNAKISGSLGDLFKGGAFDKDAWKVKNVPKVNIPKYPKGGNLGGR